jgi:hypothetical protein
MVFEQKVLAPGPGAKSRATFRWLLFQSAMSGSLFFIPPALPEVMIPNYFYRTLGEEQEEKG